MSAQDQSRPGRRTLLSIGARVLGVAPFAAAALVVSSAAFATPNGLHEIQLKGAGDADLEVTVYEGTKAATSAIPIPELSTPPFTVYNHYVEKKKSTLALKKGVAAKDTFPDGSSFEATLLETAPTPKFQLVIKDAKGAQLIKGTYTTPKGKHVLPTIIGGANSGIVPAFKVL